MMLEQELEKYLSGQTLCNCDSVSYRNIKNLILGFAEPREKRIAELKKQLDLKEKALSKAKKKTKRIADRVNKDKRRLIRRKAELEAENEQIKNSDTLCKLIGEQKAKIAELEAQIEKMKCCFNCRHSRTEYEHCKTDKHEKWEIKEK